VCRTFGNSAEKSKSQSGNWQSLAMWEEQRAAILLFIVFLMLLCPLMLLAAARPFLMMITCVCVCGCCNRVGQCKSTQSMGSAVLCVLLEPCGRILQARRSTTAGASSPAVLQVLSPRDQPYSCSLTSSPPPETRARAEREQTIDARVSLCLYVTEIT